MQDEEESLWQPLIFDRIALLRRDEWAAGMKKTTACENNEWLHFLLDDKPIAGFGVTKESVVKYNRLRELWIHGNINQDQLAARIKKICDG